jgi:hypothetical protein
MIKFKRTAEGFISIREAGAPTALPCGPRFAVLGEQEILCSFMAQSAAGINDLKVLFARSLDGGRTWRDEGFLWPELHARYALFGSISRAPGGELLFFGARTPIDQPGESFWNDSTQGLKQNELIWGLSRDGGRTWSGPTPIPMPIPGSAEAPGALCVGRDGVWHACYAPYNTFDPALRVDRNQIVYLRSEDRGRAWRHASMLRFAESYATGAEAWVVELADGRLLGACWNLNQKDGADFPNAYGLSPDGGRTWLPTRSTGIRGQSTSLTALPDGRALFTYNQRKHGEIGVWMALVRPTPEDFGIEFNEPIWRAATATVGGTSTKHSNWVDFAFGEPSTALLPGGDILTALWCVQPEGRGIRYVRGRLEG